MARECNEGYSFLFSPSEDEPACVSFEAPSLAAIHEAHPDTKTLHLDEVWCHCCANRLFPLLGDAIPWEDEWVENTVAPEFMAVIRHDIDQTKAE